MVRKRVHLVAHWARKPSVLAAVFVLFCAFVLGFMYHLNRDTAALAEENAQTLVAMRALDVRLTDAIEHQCKTDDAHDVAVRQFIRTAKDLNTLEALLGLHFLLIDKKTCKDVTG